MVPAYLALLGRIVLLGYERIAVKQLGHRADSEGATFLFFAIASLFLLPFLFFVGAPAGYAFLPLVALASLVYAVAFVLYVRSLSIGEASLVSPLYNFNVLFLLALAAILLGEPVSALRVAGILLLVGGASFLDRKRNVFLSLASLVRDRACLLMIVCSLLMAVGRTIDGLVVQDVSPVVYAFSLYSGIALLLLAYVALAGKTRATLSLVRDRPQAAVTAGAINAFSYLLLLIAFTRIDVSVAEPASMLSMGVTVTLAHFAFGERIGSRLAAVAIMVAGAWLLLA